MSFLKRSLIRYHLFHKRLFIRPAFLIILALIPLAGLLLGLAARMESGIVTVCVGSRGESRVAKEVIDELISDKGIIRFIEMSPEEAIEAVKSGDADTAWIFTADTDKKLQSFAKNGTARHSFIEVYQRREDISLLLAREKLCGAVYPHLSREVFLSFVNANITSDHDSSELLGYYEAVMAEGEDLFEINLGDADHQKGEGESSYLSAPLRGLLSVLVVLAGLALSMFYRIDSEKGLFRGLESRFAFTFGYHFAGVFDVGIAMLISLALSGVFTSFLRELLLMVLLASSVVLFCMIFRILTLRLELLCALTPIAVIAMLVICPVFFHVSSLGFLQALLPPYYYLNAVYSDAYIWKMLIYIAICTVIYLILSLGFEKGRKEA